MLEDAYHQVWQDEVLMREENYKAFSGCPGEIVRGSPACHHSDYHDTRYDDTNTYKPNAFSGLFSKTEQPKARQEYYAIGGIEVIDYIKAKLTPEQYKGYLLGNIYKYSGRCQYKGEYEKDVVKLGQYVNWLLKC